MGFIEGDGSFWFRGGNCWEPSAGASFHFDPISRRAEFEMTQSIENIKLLQKIRTRLGFGRVLVFSKNDKEYCRFYTSKRENILRLVHLLNGNLVLEKRRIQFKEWLKAIHLGWGSLVQIPLKPCHNKVSLKDAWFSGFSDADAGFFTNVINNFQRGKKTDGSYYYSFFTKFYITQEGETAALEEIKNLVGATNQVYQIGNQYSSKKYNRLEIVKSESTQLLIEYFTAFPLQGVRKIDCIRWARVYAYKKRHVVLTQHAAIKLARLISTLEERNEFSQQFLDEEQEILNDLALNQRNTFYKPLKNRKKGPCASVLVKKKASPKKKRTDNK